jgi:hypothetical protein
LNITRNASLREVSFIVCTALHNGGMEAVLTGGSAATVYAPQAYQSHDMDFVVTFQSHAVDARSILVSLGYREVQDHYEHASNILVLEFPKGPLAVGGELVGSWNTLREGEMLLHIIAPTDSCRDRLAGFMFWNDRGSLTQAVAVARAQRGAIDLDVIRRWCGKEGKSEAFLELERALSQAE